jgi:MFS family permease
MRRSAFLATPGFSSHLNMETSLTGSSVSEHRAFAALANRHFQQYFVYATAAMMADNIEHVISYWVMFEKFHSPALAGFAVISHWVPFLLFAGYTGALADRFDIRRLIQLGMLLYMGVSVTWGVLFYADAVTMWNAMLLLVVHGFAGVIWVPASQVLINRLVGHEQLSSAVRMSATGRYLGFVAGPAIGAGLLLWLGPTTGIIVNAAIYAPFLLWLIGAPGRPLVAAAARARPAISGVRDVIATMRVVASNDVLLSMTILAGAASFFVGNAYQAQMPGFAHDLGHRRADFSYSILLAADAAGGLVGGLILESRGLLKPKASSAFLLAMLWAIALIVFAVSQWFALSIVILFAAGFVELAFNAMSETLVQLNAPAEIRGRVIGVFSMSSRGLRAFSGLSVGMLGAEIGIHFSLAYSAAALLLLYGVIFGIRRWRRSK